MMQDGGPSDIELATALSLRPGVGARSVTRWLTWSAGASVPRSGWLRRTPADLVAAFPPGLDQLAAALSDGLADELAQARRLAARTTEAGGQFLLVTDGDYPKSLRARLGPTAPPVLTVFGDVDLLERPGVGLVGTRAPSEAGRTLAAYCARWCTDLGAAVVSGGAQGIDTAAHTVALESGGTTIVVLPQGLLTYSVPEFLAQAAESGRAAIVSEFAPSAPWTTHGAVTRNTTIAALSRLVCVIEPKAQGGSIRTGRAALAQGCPVFVYGGVGGREAEIELEAAGAGLLLGPAGRFEAATLDRAWDAAAPANAQSELF